MPVGYLHKNKSKIDLSSGNAAGSHTPALKGVKQWAVDDQGRKKRRATNALYLTDHSGLPLSLSAPVYENHNDLFNIKNTLQN